MHRRKIQLVGGMTYSISLPKEWVRKNGLKEKDEITITEKDNRKLIISPQGDKQKYLKNISLNVDDYINNIDQIIFAIYYLGIEKITIFSKNEITKEAKTQIRKTLTHMTGTEIVYEDKQRIDIRTFLDNSKVDIMQTFYRISLLIDSSITSILEQLDMNEIRINENEIDRLYHLLTQLVSMSLRDSNILYSSKINNISLIPSYFLMSKRLEHIGDEIKHMAEYIKDSKTTIKDEKDILIFIKTELGRCIRYILSSKNKTVFEKKKREETRAIKKQIAGLNDKTIQKHLENSLRYLIDISEEIVNISFYSYLIRNKNL